MQTRLKHFSLKLLCFVLINISYSGSEHTEKYNALNDFALWPGGIVNYQITNTHFEASQKYSIMKTMAYFTFRSCVRFVETSNFKEYPTLVIQNPLHTSVCNVPTMNPEYLEETGTAVFIVDMGYDCLTSPHIEMYFMTVLGFQFEHTRAIRDIYIDVHRDNIKPSLQYLFEKDYTFPYELSILPYDLNSVMHFDQYDYSANGSRVFTIKNDKEQHRLGLTDIDLLKIEIVYRSQCRKRDSEMKREMCRHHKNNYIRLNRYVDVTDNIRGHFTSVPSKPSTRTKNSYFEHLNCNKSQVRDYLKTVEKLEILNQTLIVVEDEYQPTSTGSRDLHKLYCNETLQSSASVRGRNLNIVDELTKYTKSYIKRATDYSDVCREPKDLKKYQWCCGFSFDHRCLL